MRPDAKADWKKISSHFGAELTAKIFDGLESYARLWGLSGFEQVDYYSINCIFNCVSDRHGLCVLKIGDSSSWAKNEYNTLLEYDGGRFCKVYEADIEGGAMLLERIAPGTRLRDEPCPDKRVELFCGVYGGLHAKPKSAYPSYMGWVSRITAYMSARGDYRELYGKMARAERICRSLSEKYTGELLLHGDLHHDNILLGGDGRYRVIDPKGVTGDAVFDIPRFILNEFDDELDDAFTKKLTRVVRMLSSRLKVPEDDIWRLTYVEMCMANCWCVESGQEPNMDEVLYAEKMMNDA